MVQKIVRGFVVEFDFGLLVASTSIAQQTYWETLVVLLHVNAKVIPDGVVHFRKRLTAAKLILDSPHSLSAAVRARWSFDFGIIRGCRNRSFIGTAAVGHASVYCICIVDPVRESLPMNGTNVP